MKTNLLLSIFCIALTGCASIVSGSTKAITVTAAQEVKVTITDTFGKTVADGPAPMEVLLYRNHAYFQAQGYQVKVSSLGYHTQKINILPSFNPWYLGNLLLPLGPVWMFAVDPVSGAFYDLNPSSINVDLQPTGENVAMLNRQAAIVKRAQSFSVSKNEYTASRLMRGVNCHHIATPEVIKSNYSESLTFECKDGRSMVVTCNAFGECNL